MRPGATLAASFALTVLGGCTFFNDFDELGPAGCQPGDERVCYDGPAGTEGVGFCRGGIATCVADGSGYGPCVGQVLPDDGSCEGGAGGEQPGGGGQGGGDGGAGAGGAPPATITTLPVTLPGIGYGGVSDLAIGPDGRLTVAWVGGFPENAIVGISIDGGESFGAPHQMLGSYDTTAVHTGAADDGTAFMSWSNGAVVRSLSGTSFEMPTAGPSTQPVALAVTGDFVTMIAEPTLFLYRAPVAAYPTAWTPVDSEALGNSTGTPIEIGHLCFDAEENFLAVPYLETVGRKLKVMTCDFDETLACDPSPATIAADTVLFRASCAIHGDAIDVLYAQGATPEAPVAGYVRLARSTDGGATFPDTVEVSDPALQANHHVPRMAGDELGQFVIAYYNGAFFGDEAGSFRVTYGTVGGGVSPTSAVAAPSVPFSPATLGTSIGLAVRDGVFYATYTDVNGAASLRLAKGPLGAGIE